MPDGSDEPALLPEPLLPGALLVVTGASGVALLQRLMVTRLSLAKRRSTFRKSTCSFAVCGTAGDLFRGRLRLDVVDDLLYLRDLLGRLMALRFERAEPMDLIEHQADRQQEAGQRHRNGGDVIEG